MQPRLLLGCGQRQGFLRAMCLTFVTKIGHPNFNARSIGFDIRPVHKTPPTRANGGPVNKSQMGDIQLIFDGA